MAMIDMNQLQFGEILKLTLLSKAYCILEFQVNQSSTKPYYPDRHILSNKMAL